MGSDRELLQQAMDALHYCFGATDREESERRRIIAALRARLAQPEPEPVAWMSAYDRTDLYYRKPPQADVVPLYRTTPGRQWVDLTDHEIALINADYPHPQGFARGVSAALKDKNT